VNQVQLPPAQAWTFARLPLLVRDLKLHTDTVLHVGAHLGEEVPIYRQCGYSDIRLVEPDPAQVDYLSTHYGDAPDIQITAAAVTTGGPSLVSFYRRERTVHGSLFPSKDAEPITVRGVLMSEIQDLANLIVVDVQGLEFEITRTIDLTRPGLQMVIVETTRRHGDSAGYFDQVVEYMTSWGWTALEEWIHDQSGYTDTVFISPIVTAQV
jgi:FkbM family methyltransferase